MTAYVILDINIHNLEGYEDYKKLSPAAVAAYGGKLLCVVARLKHSKVIGHRSAW